MIEILEFALSSFWKFIGCIIILNGAAYFLVNMILKIWSRLTRVLMVRKHGWPPTHLDADGDYIKIKKSSSED